MEKVKRTDIQRGRDGNLATSGHQFFCELDASVSVIEATIDVRRGDTNKGLCTK